MKPIPPTPFCMVRDTREQHPLDFGDIANITDGCYPGDYSIVGFRDRFAVERKGVTCNQGVWTSDLVATITELLRAESGDLNRGSFRFKWELDAMSRIVRAGGVAFVATDRPESWYMAHKYYGGLHPNALMRKIHSLYADFGVDFKFFESTADMTNYILSVSLEVWKHEYGLSSHPRLPDSKPPSVWSKWMREVGSSL